MATPARLPPPPGIRAPRARGSGEAGEAGKASAAAAAEPAPASAGEPTEPQQEAAAAADAAAAASAQPSPPPDLPDMPESLSGPEAFAFARKHGKGLKWARKQVAEVKNMQRQEGQNEYNIWYHKYLGHEKRVRERATTRCSLKRDAGLTKGSFINAEGSLCIHFAKGCCAAGPDCSFLHRAPTMHDALRTDPMHDVFGRERHRSEREDMDGVGCFNRENRTLYVGDLVVSDLPMEEILRRHFGEWGEIEEISVKRRLGCAFVRFVNRVTAEFAKVAMSGQSLDHGENLNVKWAFDDPNPRAKQREQEEREFQVLLAMQRRGLLSREDMERAGLGPDAAPLLAKRAQPDASDAGDAGADAAKRPRVAGPQLPPEMAQPPTDFAAAAAAAPQPVSLDAAFWAQQGWVVGPDGQPYYAGVAQPQPQPQAEGGDPAALDRLLDSIDARNAASAAK
jgi:hypothetical protein